MPRPPARPTNLAAGPPSPHFSTRSWLIAIAFWLSGGFIRSGLGARIAYTIVSLFGKTTLGLTYSLVAAEALLAPAIPSVAARAGGLFLPLAKALCLACGSDPEKGTEKKMGAFVMMTCFLCTTISSGMFITAMAANPLSVNLAAEAIGTTITWGAPSGGRRLSRGGRVYVCITVMPAGGTTTGPRTRGRAAGAAPAGRTPASTRRPRRRRRARRRRPFLRCSHAPAGAAHGQQLTGPGARPSAPRRHMGHLCAGPGPAVPAADARPDVHHLPARGQGHARCARQGEHALFHIDCCTPRRGLRRRTSHIGRSTCAACRERSGKCSTRSKHRPTTVQRGSRLTSPPAPAPHPPTHP